MHQRRVQATLAKNAAPTSPTRRRRTSKALLAGLLRCGPCDAPMLSTHTTKNGRRYEYYACQTTRAEGWDACTTKSIAALEIERVVVDQIRAIGKDEGLVAQVLDAAREQAPDLDERDLRRTLALFDPVWDARHAHEKKRVLDLLIEDVAYDKQAGTVEFSFRPCGIQALAEEVDE